MNRTAHVQAAGQGNTYLGRQGHAGKVIEQLIHNRLNHTGSIGGRGMAVDPTLGMNDIGNTGTGAANRESCRGLAVINKG